MSQSPQLTRTSRSTLHRLFDLSLYIKGVDGLLELVGGLLFWLLPPQAVGTAVRLVTAHELSEDPSDRIATALRHATSAWLAHPGHFASIYLIGHGMLKLFLVVNVLREKLWAFVPAMLFLAAFVVYQLYRFAHTHALTLLVFSAMDIVIIAVIYREFARLRGAR